MRCAFGSASTQHQADLLSDDGLRDKKVEKDYDIDYECFHIANIDFSTITERVFGLVMLIRRPGAPSLRFI